MPHFPCKRLHFGKNALLLGFDNYTALLLIRRFHFCATPFIAVNLYLNTYSSIAINTTNVTLGANKAHLSYPLKPRLFTRKHFAR